MTNEKDRIDAVKRFKQLDDGIVKQLNDIVQLTAQICNTSMAIVTLIDENTQWFKASTGVDITCTSREVSFCNYTITHDDVLVVDSPETDERFANNPLVTGDPHVKFYAGNRLTTKDGFSVGSLCVIDVEPRALNEHQLNALKVLSKQVICLMEFHWSMQSLDQEHKKTQEQKLSIEASEIKLKAIFDSSKDTHILVGKNLEILAYNKSAETFINTVYKHKITYGNSILDYTEERLSKQFSKYLAIALSGRSIKREWLLMPDSIHECWKETSFIPIKDKNGDVIGVALNSTDVTTRKRHEKLINVQNEALTRIAIIQSHELRRPVASLLGIIDLMKMEDIDFSYFKMLQVTVNELDEKIRSIVKDSEDTIHGSHLSIVA